MFVTVPSTGVGRAGLPGLKFAGASNSGAHHPDAYPHNASPSSFNAQKAKRGLIGLVALSLTILPLVAGVGLLALFTPRQTDADGRKMPFSRKCANIGRGCFEVLMQTISFGAWGGHAPGQGMRDQLKNAFRKAG